MLMYFIPRSIKIDFMGTCKCLPLQVRNAIAQRGLFLVGWYHSHPSYQPDPSLQDIQNQLNYQSILQQENAPYGACLGIIVCKCIQGEGSEGSYFGEQGWHSGDGNTDFPPLWLRFNSWTQVTWRSSLLSVLVLAWRVFLCAFQFSIHLNSKHLKFQFDQEKVDKKSHLVECPLLNTHFYFSSHLATVLQKKRVFYPHNQV